MGRQFVVIAYDLPDDQRRDKLHQALLNYSTPVQYSMFECLVNDQELARLKKQVKRIIKPRLDHVRYYLSVSGVCEAWKSPLKPFAALKQET